MLLKYTFLETTGKVPINGKYVLHTVKLTKIISNEKSSSKVISKYLNNAILGKCNFSTQTWKLLWNKHTEILLLGTRFSKYERTKLNHHTVFKSSFSSATLFSEGRLFNLMTIQAEPCNVQASHSSHQTKQMLDLLFLPKSYENICKN